MSQKSVPMTTVQPVSWIEAFKRQASLEGYTFSEWVGLACKERVASQLGLDRAKILEMFPTRPGRGTPVRKGVTADAT